MYQEKSKITFNKTKIENNLLKLTQEEILNLNALIPVNWITNNILKWKAPV